jgi:hypothetical protein
LNASADILTRALDYPYPVPDHDYLFCAGGSRPLPIDFPFTGLTPVVAVGSNRSPQQLQRKFGTSAVMAVTRVQLTDYDVVYSAHMARYGSVPACLFPSPQTTVEVWVNWLDTGQLADMHLTEAVGVNYDFIALPKGAVSGTGLGPRLAAHYYKSRRGALAIDGRPIALSAVTARQRQYLAYAQEDILRHVHQQHGTGAFITWLTAMIGDDPQRLRLTDRLSAAAINA